MRALASNAVSSGFDLHKGRFTLSGYGFFGAMTTESLLENDPAVASNFESAKLGDVIGMESGVRFDMQNLSIASNIGTMHENKTVLGAAFGGMLDMRGSDTGYIDSVVPYQHND